MGYLFENMEKMDIQEECKKVAMAKQELAEVESELTQAKSELEEKDEQLEVVLKYIITNSKHSGNTKAQVIGELVGKMNLELEVANYVVDKYWEYE